MEKSVYSLMLFDDIVEKIDELASVLKTNRSQLVNDIIAEHLGLMTPEQKIQRIIENLYNSLSKTLTVHEIKKNTSIKFGKNLNYKYKPEIKYCFEFAGSGNKKYAVLKISSRTTSKNLNSLFDKFFSLIKQLEINNNVYRESEKETSIKYKFIREFRNKGSLNRDLNEVSQFLTNYLQMIDQAMNLFFIKDKTNLSQKFQSLYEHYLMPKDLQIITENPIVLI